MNSKDSLNDENLFFFNNFWHLLCHEKEVEKNNTFICIKHEPFDLILYNDQNKLICFDNICPHRGSKFVSKYTGKGPLVCPYHGFCYINGGLKTGKHKPLNKVNISLKKFKFEKIGKFIFFSINPILNIKDQFDIDTINSLELISKNISYIFDYNQVNYECSADLAIENALEAVHVNVVHPNTLASLNLDKGKDKKIGSSSEWVSEIKNKKIVRAFDSISKLYGIIPNKYYKNIFLFPFSMISSSGGISYSIQNFFPKKNNTTNFISRLYPDKKYFDNMKLAKIFFESTAKLNRQIFEEDANICSMITKDKDQSKGTFLVEGEERLQWYREAKQKFLQKLN